MADETPRQDTPGSPRLTILVAAFALVGVLLGAAIGGTFTYLAADREARAAEEQSNVEFVRTQRLAAYSQFLAASEDLKRTHEEFVRLFLTDVPRPSGVKIKTVKDPVDDAYNRVNQAASLIAIVGSSEASTLAQNILLENIKDYRWVETSEILVNFNVPDDHYVSIKRNIADTAIADERDKLIVEFLMQARKDIVHQ